MSEKLVFKFDEIDFGTILTELIAVDTITDIEVRNDEVWIVDIKKGRYRYPLEERNDFERAELRSCADKIPRQLGIRMVNAYNEGNPILDGETTYSDNGQLRINAIHESLTGGGCPGIAIRKTTFNLRLSEDTMMTENYTTKEFLDLMNVLLKSGCNVMITGLTGSGKTELLKYVARYIRKNEAIITIEDTFEAYLKRIYPEKEVLALKSNKNQGFSELIRACLRQNPDWIMVSETRGEEVKELMEAVGTGHHLISTIHSDSALNIPWRMVDMAKVDGAEATRMFRQVHQNINIGIYIHYYNDGNGSHRKITEMCEFYLDEDGNPKSHMIYWYDYTAKQYKTDKIRSTNIKNRIIRSGVNTKSIGGVFL